ncbi:hypothetical protein ATANTOWER_023370, partial [Ataeniobius toweri]|nr:hypothetical protein [Ataeniobius toweri]
MAGPPKCRLRANIGTFTPHRQTNRNPQGQPGSQETQNHQHPSQPSKNDTAAPSRVSSQANATATPHILPYIGRGTIKTTNPKHTPHTRNHPADKQTPPQYKAEKRDGTAEPSDACPTTPTLRGQSCHPQDHRQSTIARHTAGDRMQQK